MPKSGLEGHRSRLRERFLKSGLIGFHDHEILELLLTYAIPGKDVKPIVKDLLNEFGNNLASMFDAPAEALQRVDEIGEHAAVLIGLIPRLFDSYQSSRWVRHGTFVSTETAVSYLQALFGTQRNEVFYVLALDSQNQLIAVERIQRGSVNRTAVFPRLVVEACLKHRATAVILAHNHPGGSVLPSAGDRQLPHKLKNLLGDLDIVVHDHIIIAGCNQYYSFAETGELVEWSLNLSMPATKVREWGKEANDALNTPSLKRVYLENSIIS
jgi:DNA repair protein RadC